jgi:hypothetical protein
MYDQPVLFRNFERINKQIIKVGGGVMYCNHKGIAENDIGQCTVYTWISSKSTLWKENLRGKAYGSIY